MEKHTTNETQSKRLLEFGVNPDTADMAYEWYLMPDGTMGKRLRVITDFDPLSSTDTPVWSSYALMKLLPAEIKPKGKNTYSLKEFKRNAGDKGIVYGVSYTNGEDTFLEYSTASEEKFSEVCHDFVDCQVNLLIKLMIDKLLPNDEETKKNFIKRDEKTVKSFISGELKKIYEPGVQETIADCFGLK